MTTSQIQTYGFARKREKMSIIGLSKLETVDLVIDVTSIERDTAKINQNNLRNPKIVTREISNY